MTCSQKIAAFVIALGIAACGGPPARTETTSTTSVERTGSGGEVRHQSTETVVVEDDGSQSSDRTESTQTEVPATNSQ